MRRSQSEVHGSIQALVFDLDDTLLDRAKRIGPRTRRALDRWLDQGGTVIIATARPSRSVRRYLPPDLLARCHRITLNGAVLQALGEDPLPLAHLGPVAQEVLALPDIGPDLRLSVELLGEDFGCNQVLDPVTLADYQSATPDLLLPLDHLPLDRVTKVAIDGLGRDLMHLAPGIEALGPRIHPALDGTFLNVVDPTVDKAVALARLLERLAIRSAQAIAFGDDLPDLGMLRLVGTAIAMGNARPQVQAIADVVLDDCDDDGIGPFIDRLGSPQG